MRAPASPSLDQAAAREQIGAGAGGGPPAQARVTCREDFQELAGAPVRVGRPFRHEELGDRRRDLVEAVPRGAAPVHEAAPPLGIAAREPLAADPTADALAGTQLAHGEAIAQRIAPELQAFVHGRTLLPRHRRSSRSGVSLCKLRV